MKYAVILSILYKRRTVSSRASYPPIDDSSNDAMRTTSHFRRRDKTEGISSASPECKRKAKQIARCRRDEIRLSMERLETRMSNQLAGHLMDQSCSNNDQETGRDQLRTGRARGEEGQVVMFS